ncbi:hypothetical protein AKO1_011532 [Acrasis kona]|uniref:Cytochrome P450 n=1 Tax=Acrasis kona TaxID=1008807 RepID=A0AAW2Z395_9EUKA
MIHALLVATLLVIALAYAAIKVIDHRAKMRFKPVDPSQTKQIPTAGVMGLLRFLFVAPFSKENKDVNIHHNHHNNFHRLNTDQGIFHSFFGPLDSVIVVDPDAIKKVVLNDRVFPKLDILRNKLVPINRMLGDNLVFLNGKDWKQHRHIINPAFYDISKFVGRFDKHIDTTLEILARQEVNNVSEAMTNMAVDILGETVLGHDLGAQEGRIDTILKSYNLLVSGSSDFVRFMFPSVNMIPSKFNQEFDYHLSKLNEFVYKIIDEAKIKNKKLLKDEQEHEEPTLLDLMIQSQLCEKDFAMDDKMLRDNAVVFFVAGHETTASALCFALYQLSQHPEAQQRLYDEIIDITEGQGDLTIEKLASMDYLDAVIKETLRLHPPINILDRVAHEDTVLCGYKIPKGTVVTVGVYTSQTCEKYYGPTAREFRPERWLEQNGKDIHRFAHVPFGAGARVCLGNNFSLVEQKLFLVKLLTKFMLKPDPKYPRLQYKRAPILMNISEDFTLRFVQRD